jgi:hypothetical protein
VIVPLVPWSYTTHGTDRTNRGQIGIFVTGACRCRLACYIPRSLCRNRLRDAKRKSRWLNALKLVDQAKCCGPRQAAGTCLLLRAQSGSGNSRRLQLSMLLTKIGLKKTYRSIEATANRSSPARCRSFGANLEFVEDLPLSLRKG